MLSLFLLLLLLVIKNHTDILWFCIQISFFSLAKNKNKNSMNFLHVDSQQRINRSINQSFRLQSKLQVFFSLYSIPGIFDYIWKCLQFANDVCDECLILVCFFSCSCMYLCRCQSINQSIEWWWWIQYGKNDVFLLYFKWQKNGHKILWIKNV